MEKNYTNSLSVSKSAHEIFEAINNVRAWWSEDIEGITDQKNAIWNYSYQDVHCCTLKVVEFVPHKKVVWLVLDNYFSFTKNKDEWKGNSIQFDIIPKSDHTEIKFTQFGLVSSAECYDICENAWNTYLQNSLYQLIESGKGHPNSSEQPQTSDERNLGNANFTTTFFVNQSPELVFNAINQVSSWWQGKITGLSNENGDQFTYQMEDMHLSSQKVTEFIPFKKIAWLVTKSKLSWANEKEEWTGTTIHFEIKEINNKTQLRFTHEGLNPKCECFAECAAAWEKLIQESLYSLITTGKGTRVFG